MKKLLVFILSIVLVFIFAFPVAALQANTQIGLSKYKPEIKITTVSISYPWLVYPEGDSVDNNVWTRYYKEKLGITIKHSWTAPGDQYQTKLTASIASGDIPDVMSVDEGTFKMCIDSDLIQNIGSAYEKYATSEVKTQVYGGSNGKANLGFGTVKGKMMALPGPMGNPAESATILYVRKDWLSKLKLPEPKSLNDLWTIVKAFTTQDPDGNGKNDTFGLGVAKDFVHSPYGGGIGDLLGIYNGYHAYPGIWIDDKKGGLTYGSIQQQMKPALAKLNEMFKAGYIDKEFGVKDRWKVGEEVAAGKIGVIYGVTWTPVVPLVNNFNNNKDAVWKEYAIPSINSKPALVNGYSWTPSFYVVSKKCKNPEALIKMANLSYDTSYGATAKKAKNFAKDISYKFGVSQDNKYQFAYYQVVNLYPGDKNLQSMLLLDQAMKTGDTSKLLPETVSNYNGLQRWMDGERTAETFNFWHLKAAGFIVAFDYFKSNHVNTNGYTSIQTPTMLEKMKTLDDMASQVYTKIIMEGNTDAEFNKFVADWKKLGGDTITKEVNDWFKSTKK